MFRYRDASNFENATRSDFKSHYHKIQRLINTRVHLSLKYDQLRSPEIRATLMSPITHEIVAICESTSLNLDVCTHLIFILLLLRYEYFIQSENNLLYFDLLSTKAMVCEILAVRMLREYKSQQRIKMLFYKCPHPIKINGAELDINTFELGVLTSSKLFLSQPIIIQILDRFYEGDLVQSEKYMREDDEKSLLGDDFGNLRAGRRISFSRLFYKANVVPRYQTLALNLKLIVFAALYFVMMFGPVNWITETSFWVLGVSLNLELFLKVTHIDHRFLNMILWNHIDLWLIIMLDASFLMRFFVLRHYYTDIFSLIGVILFPRLLSVFSNYKSFNLIVISFNKMIWNLVGLVFFFFTLISGFYFSFIALNQDQSKGVILFNMVKIFFGFTPSVWDNWEYFNTLGKMMQMLYLFLIQFIVGTILAICLSGIFLKARENMQQEFYYYKSKNMVSYFRMAKLNQRRNLPNYFLQLFKAPVVLVIFVDEFISTASHSRRSPGGNLKNFVFFKSDEPFGDAGANERNQIFLKNHQSLSTLGGGQLRTGSTDSFFIDQLLSRKYGTGMGTGISSSTEMGTGKIEKSSNNEDRKISSKRMLSPNAQPQSLQRLSSAHRRHSLFHQSSPSCQQTPAAFNSNMAGGLLSRITTLEHLKAKRSISSDADDNKSVLIYDIAEIAHDDDDLEKDGESISSEIDSLENSLEATPPMHVGSIAESDLDHYDSDRTFQLQHG
ncbi:uncharacterized protein LODBEIA_P35040 [Lodderomyces beijingensis]|uniref:Ion transport domain-containing protein n=1 Tax=Lodderomyces beijingensis TaxID=1775926 RepID=A0ABP0ZM96_9ASCO